MILLFSSTTDPYCIVGPNHRNGRIDSLHGAHVVTHDFTMVLRCTKVYMIVRNYGTESPF